MTRLHSFFRRTSADLGGSLVALFHAADLASPPAIRRSRRCRRCPVNPFLPAHLELLRRRLRRHVVIERLRFGFPDVLLEDDAHDHVLEAAGAAADADAIALTNLAIRLGMVVVDVHLAAFAGALRLGPRLEQARDVEPDVEAEAVTHERGVRSLF